MRNVGKFYKELYEEQQEELQKLRRENMKYLEFVSACRYVSAELVPGLGKQASEILGLPANEMPGTDVNEAEKLTCPFCKQKRKFLLQFPVKIRVQGGDMILRDGVGVERTGMDKEICFNCLEREADALY